jgi:2-dehydropantoate 2-reductase
MTKILVIGSGAIGCFYSSKLWQAGAEICLLVRKNFHEVQEKGINILSINQNFCFRPQLIINDLEKYQQQPDYILIATKVLPSIDLPSIISSVLAKHTKIILIQNGINIECDLAKKFQQQIISVVAFVCVAKLNETTVHHQDNGHLIIGNYQQKASADTHFLAHLFNQVGIKTTVSNHIQTDRWEKLIWNASFNPISVLSNSCNTKQMLENKHCRQLIIHVMQEIFLLAKADGCFLSNNVIANKISYTEKMIPYETSMLLDFKNNRSMEIEAILGNAIKFAQEKSIPTPHLSTLYALLTCF